MSYLFLSIIGIYCAVIMWANVKWVKITKYKLPAPKNQPGLFSVIVPVRNEAHNINRLLTAIARQSFSKRSFEVIIVDDHSKDGTLEIVMKQSWPFKISTCALKAINRNESFILSGKKQAIALGIRQASGSIVVTTDADCHMGEEWLQSIYNYFSSFDAQMVVGPVVYDSVSGIFEELQSIEFAALIGTGAVALDAGNPNMCNGANLAFKKEAFEAVDGYEGNFHIPSGDDEFLLQKIYNRFPRQVFFNAAKAAIVHTEPVKECATFINQRRRWSSKWKLHKSLAVKVLATGVFCFHLGLIISLAAVLSGYLHWYVFIMGFCAKAIVEFLFLKKLLDHFGKSLHLMYFVTLQGIYSIYVVVFGVLSNFGSFEWKGRSYKQ